MKQQDIENIATQARDIKSILYKLEDALTELDIAKTLAYELDSTDLVSSDNNFDELIQEGRRKLIQAFHLLDDEATPTIMRYEEEYGEEI